MIDATGVDLFRTDDWRDLAHSNTQRSKVTSRNEAREYTLDFVVKAMEDDAAYVIITDEYAPSYYRALIKRIPQAELQKASTRRRAPKQN